MSKKVVWLNENKKKSKFFTYEHEQRNTNALNNKKKYYGSLV